MQVSSCVYFQRAKMLYDLEWRSNIYVSQRLQNSSLFSFLRISLLWGVSFAALMIVLVSVSCV